MFSIYGEPNLRDSSFPCQRFPSLLLCTLVSRPVLSGCRTMAVARKEWGEEGLFKLKKQTNKENSCYIMESSLAKEELLTESCTKTRSL